MSELILATTSEEWETRVRRAFDGRLNGELCRRGDVLPIEDTLTAARALIASAPRVVVVGPELSPSAALDLARSIDDERPDVCVVLVADPTPALFEQALRAGVRDIVPPDAPLTELRATLQRAWDTSARRRATAAEERTRQASRCITVVSPKGGAGKTAIATNLAVGLAQRAPGEVVLIDLDVQFGDVASALRLDADGTVADVARSLAAVDSTAMKAYLTPHDSGLFVLCAPVSPAAADDVTAEHVTRILELVTGVFPYVVVDTAAGLDEIALAAMEHSTDLVVVCGTDVASTRGMRKELEAFDLLGLTTQRRHFALNRADARVGLSVRDIEATVGMPADVAIPSSRAVPLSMNQGIPMLETDERSPVSRAFAELVDRFHVVAAETPRPTPPGGLRRRRKESPR